MADARFEHPRNGDGSRFYGDMTIVRSTHGITAVRQRVCVSNDIAVHALEVDVDIQAGPAWGGGASAIHSGVFIFFGTSRRGSRQYPGRAGYAPPKGALALGFYPPLAASH